MNEKRKILKLVEKISLEIEKANALLEIIVEVRIESIVEATFESKLENIIEEVFDRIDKSKGCVR